MTYEQALKLKNAGFPHDGYSKGDIVLDDVICEQCNDKHDAYAPTLSELIEVCGDKFGALQHQRVLDAQTWLAYSANIENKLGIESHIVQQGDTPEEAVANLWLALNSHE